jgi:iron complex transport system substrate-binding protein
VISQNPDILLGAMSIKKKEDILNSNPFIMKTTAGKKGNIAIVESSKILRPTPRIIDVVEELYEELRGR